MDASLSITKLCMLSVFLLSLFILCTTLLYIKSASSPFNVTAPNLEYLKPNTISLVSYTATPVKKPTQQQLPSEKIVLLFWSKLFNQPATRLERVLEKGEERGQCPVACEVTINRSRVEEAKAFVVHSRDIYPLPPRSPHVPWVLTTLENPVYAHVLSNAKVMSQFHLLRSYRLDSDFPTPGFKKPGLEPPIPFKNKTGGIMAAFSNCEEVRTAYLQELMKFIKVDSYGECLHNKDGLKERYGEDFKKLKQDLERSYKFVIVFFNQDCDYFVDDQILHALNAGTVPVVMGTDKIYRFLPGNLKNAIVNIRDFKTPQHLAARLKFLMDNETEYNKFLEWKVKGLGNISDTVIGKYWESKFGHWCEMCESVSQGRWHRGGLKADVCRPRRYEDWGIRRPKKPWWKTCSINDSDHSAVILMRIVLPSTMMRVQMTRIVTVKLCFYNVRLSTIQTTNVVWKAQTQECQ